ncbi:MAG: hypothetical protein JJ902_14755 [Roseibium sp.]|nr:hypothetical protein [Roseibium sp.]
MTFAPQSRETPFFVGYLNKVPASLVAFLGVFSVCFVAGMGLAAFMLSSTNEDPGDGAFRWGMPFEETGVLELKPYPVFRVDGADGAPPRTYMLSGQGKRGAFGPAYEHEGMPVVLKGVPVKRGDLTMIQVGGVSATEEGGGAFETADPESLGRWRLTGEICDGKCYAGAMRPGRGLAHKACADLCLAGGIPPVFVSTGAVEGRTFFMMTDQNGEVLGDEIDPLLALFIEIEGDVERLDDLLIFKADFETARVIR